MYIADYYYSGHGEIHILETEDGSVRVLTPSYALLNTASGSVVKGGCTEPGECHPAEIRDGQITFINSRNPRWSPDGGQIAFESMGFDAANGNAPIYHTFQMNANGSDIRALTERQAMELSAAWSRDVRPPETPPQIDYESTVEGLRIGCVAWQPE